MILPRAVADAHGSTEKRRCQFGGQLLRRVGLIAEASTKVPIKARLGASPVPEFVEDGGIVGFRIGACRRAAKQMLRRHGYLVGRPVVEGALALVPDRGFGCRDKGLGFADLREY